MGDFKMPKIIKKSFTRRTPEAFNPTLAATVEKILKKHFALFPDLKFDLRSEAVKIADVISGKNSSGEKSDKCELPLPKNKRAASRFFNGLKSSLNQYKERLIISKSRTGHEIIFAHKRKGTQEIKFGKPKSIARR